MSKNSYTCDVVNVHEEDILMMVQLTLIILKPFEESTYPEPQILAQPNVYH